MIGILLALFASPLMAQDTPPIYDLSRDGVVQEIVSQFEDRFSVAGGTLTGSMYINGSSVPTVGSSNTWTGSAIYTGDVQLRGGVSGVATFNDPIAVGAATPAAASFVLNQLTKSLVPVGMLNYDQKNATINASVNVTSVTDISAGVFRINWAQAMTTADYYCSLTATDEPATGNGLIASLCSDGTANCNGMGTWGVDARTRDSAGTLVDSVGVNVICFGGSP